MPAVKKPSWTRQEAEVTKVFKKALVDKEWTVAHLAELIHKQPCNVSRIINNPSKVSLETILLIANKLDISSIPIIK